MRFFLANQPSRALAVSPSRSGRVAPSRLLLGRRMVSIKGLSSMVGCKKLFAVRCCLLFIAVETTTFIIIRISKSFDFRPFCCHIVVVVVVVVLGPKLD